MNTTGRRQFLQRSVSIVIGIGAATVAVAGGTAALAEESWRDEEKRHEEERRQTEARRVEERRRLEEEQRRREAGDHREPERR